MRFLGRLRGPTSPTIPPDVAFDSLGIEFNPSERVGWSDIERAYLVSARESGAPQEFVALELRHQIPLLIVLAESPGGRALIAELSRRSLLHQ